MPHEHKPSGLWLPLITPFKDGAVDFASYERLVDALHRASASTGCSRSAPPANQPTLDDAEIEALVERTLAVAAGRVPVFVGVGGNATHKVAKTLKRLERLPFDGIVSVCPYYNRPSQDGLIAHFRAIAAATDRDVLIYNIPYRTAVNLSNDSLLELAEVPNIVGVKDSSGSIAQSLELLARKPADFSVLTGEDALYFTMMANGADGGILAASHLMTERFVEVGRCFADNDLAGARAAWAPLAPWCRCCSPRPIRCRSSTAVAAGPDRLARMPPAADEDFRRAGAAARPHAGDRLAA